MAVATASLNIGPGMTVRALNKGEHDLSIKYNKMTYILKPGIEKLIPWEAAQIWFGDPRTSDEMRFIENHDGSKQMIYPRQAEIRRLRSKYGNHEGMGEFGDETKVYNCPDVDLFTDDGEQIITVLQDPQGESSNPALISRADQDSVYQLLKKQQSQIDMLTDELRKTGRLEEIDDEDEEGLVSIQSGDLLVDDE